MSKQVQHALDECRILVIGMQVLTGFAFQSFLRPGFEKLGRADQLWKLGSLGLVALALAMIMAPALHHRIVEGGRDTPRMLRFTTRLMALALVPFALSLGVEIFAATNVVLGRAASVGAGCAFAAGALGAWYLPALGGARRRGNDEGGGRGSEGGEVEEQPKLSDRIREVLAEVRVVLPGAQALLGFQLAGVLQDTFARLPFSSRCVHLASLGLVALATILLMVPAAYHRIALRGEETNPFVKLASAFLLAALVPLALGIAGDVYVTAAFVLHSSRAGLWAGGLAAAVALSLWYGWALVRRARGPSEDAPGGAGAAPSPQH